MARDFLVNVEDPQYGTLAKVGLDGALAPSQYQTSLLEQIVLLLTDIRQAQFTNQTAANERYLTGDNK